MMKSAYTRNHSGSKQDNDSSKISSFSNISAGGREEHKEIPSINKSADNEDSNNEA